MKYIYTLIFALFFSTVSVQAQVNIYRNNFTSQADLNRLTYSFSKVFKTDEPVAVVNSTTENYLSIRGNNGNGAARGYTGYITIPTPVTFYPGSIYQITFRARTIAQDSQIRFQRGATAAIAGSTSGTDISAISPENIIRTTVAGYTNYTTTVTVSSERTEYLAFYVNSILNESNNNNEYLYVDEIVVTSTCAVIPRPSAANVSRCGKGDVTLTAGGAPASGSYRWYSASTGGTLLASSASYTALNLGTTTLYYVSAVNGAGCESERVPVTATVMEAAFAKTEFVKQDLEVGKPAVIKLNSELFEKGHAVSITWQTVSSTGAITNLGQTDAPNASPASFQVASVPDGGTYFRAIITPQASVCYDVTALDVTSQVIVALPVELVSFRAASNADGVKLTWRTASELDNSGFEVQASTDGKTFKKIGFVASKVGTTSLAQNYSFLDTKAAAGTNYYRLKQIDFDGTFEYSRTIAASVVLSSSTSVYPTLTSDEITIKLRPSEEQVSIQIADLTGKQQAAVQNPTDRQVVMPVQHLQNGVYLVTVISGSRKEVFRFVKR